jgi:hypothetical protein
MDAEQTDMNEEIPEPTDVLVLATGVVKASKYVSDYGAIGERIREALLGVEVMNLGKIDTVYVRGSSQIESVLDQKLDVEVTDAFFPWTDFVNDTAETNAEGEEVVPAVRKPDEEVIDVDLSSDEVREKVSNDRLNRAKAKAGAKMNHYLFSEYYDEFPDIDAVVTVNGGSARGVNEVLDARGVNKWIEGKAGHVEKLIDVNVQAEIIYPRVLLDDNEDMTVEDLHESQREELREELTAAERVNYGLVGARNHSTEVESLIGT